MSPILRKYLRKEKITQRRRKPYQHAKEIQSIPEADMPVPDRLFPRGKSKWLTDRLKLSQRIGLLLFLNREELLSPGGQERLLYLQSKAPFSAIEAGLVFAQRLSSELKLQSDFRHQMIELNRRPQSKRFRRYETSRIGVGYRDKGTLPEVSTVYRRRADEESFVLIEDLPVEMFLYISAHCPDSVVDGTWLDLGIIKENSLGNFPYFPGFG
jgi:hypothetical protein